MSSNSTPRCVLLSHKSFARWCLLYGFNLLTWACTSPSLQLQVSLSSDWSNHSPGTLRSQVLLNISEMRARRRRVRRTWQRTELITPSKWLHACVGVTTMTECITERWSAVMRVSPGMPNWRIFLAVVPIIAQHFLNRIWWWRRSVSRIILRLFMLKKFHEQKRTPQIWIPS